ncbi:hypothetical protein BC827DRAFT_1106314, partial [Russula dissimulans]
PILLLEPCGQPVEDPPLTNRYAVKVVGLLVRLCAASFTQGSFYLHRRVAWPAHIPRKKPSLDELSFRIIDIGSG